MEGGTGQVHLQTPKRCSVLLIGSGAKEGRNRRQCLSGTGFQVSYWAFCILSVGRGLTVCYKVISPICTDRVPVVTDSHRVTLSAKAETVLVPKSLCFPTHPAVFGI